MIKRTLLCVSGALLALGCYAAPLTPEQAMQRMQTTTQGKKLAKGLANPQLTYTENTSKGEAAVYVFNRPSENGFMFLAADDIALPVLGYTDEGSFDPNNIPPQVAYWLDFYTREIETAKASGLTASVEELGLTFPSSWQPVAPLLTTRWDQNAPFNNQTPELNGKHTPTGCVATAMAQVMNYWQYPEIGEGSISFTTSQVGSLSMTFSRQDPFDWDNMLDSYTPGRYNDTQAQAVSNLMKICGYSVQMNYRASASGTQAELVVVALKKFFKYSQGITAESRISYTASEWNELVYKQLAIGPVIFAANSLEAGHCFVIDGYDGNGYFHVNWGWGGSCNGYYTLNALNPAVQGTGGSYGGYNIDQSILAGVQPTNEAASTPGKITLSLYGSVKGSVSNGQLTMNIINSDSPELKNETPVTMSPSFGFMVTKEDGSGTPTYITCTSPNWSNQTMVPGSYVPVSSTNFRGRLDSASLADGTYRVRLVTKPYEGASWTTFNINPADYDYIILKKVGNSYGVTNMTAEKFTIENAQITTPLFYDNQFLLELTVNNPSDKELTQFIVPQLYLNGKLMFSGENQLVTVGPKEQTKITLNSSFQAEQGATLPGVNSPVEYDFSLYNLGMGTSYGDFGKVSMDRSSNNVTITNRGLSITNAVEKGLQGDMGFVYGIDNFSNINIEQKLEIKGGYMATQLSAVISEYETGNNVGKQLYEKDFDEVYYMTPGEYTYSTTLHFDNFDVSKYYVITVYYVKNNNTYQLSSLRFGASSGVEEIIASDDVVSFEIFDTNGRKVGGKAEYDTLPKGIYIVRTVSTSGKVNTTKVIK